MTTTTRVWVVAITAWLTALFPAHFAFWMLTLYATHGGTLTAALNMARPSLEVTFIYVAAGVLYLRTPALRGVILFGALAWAVVGFVRMPGYIHFLADLNPWRNLLAEGLGETFGCAAIACAAAFDLVMERISTR